MAEMIVFDFVAGTVMLRDHTGQVRAAPEVLELVATDAGHADNAQQ